MLMWRLVMEEGCSIDYFQAKQMDFDEIKEANAALDFIIEQKKKAMKKK